MDSVEFREKVAERLSTVIDERGIKGSYLANIIGVTQQTWWLKINGKVGFDLEQVAKIKDAARFTNDEIAYIFLLCDNTICAM